MSESTPAVPEPILPKKRRRWVLVLLAMLLAGGGAYWWRNHLTPEERLLVGRWRCRHRMTSGSIVETVEEFRNNRTLFTSGRHCRWTVEKGQIAIQESSPLQKDFTEWIQSGFKNWPVHETIDGRVEIVDDDTLIIMMRNRKTGEYEDKSELKRTVEK